MYHQELGKESRLRSYITVCLVAILYIYRIYVFFFSVMYALILAFAFVVIPFSYFYYEEYDEDITVKQRIVGGLKYTVFLLVIVIVSLFK